MKLRQCDSTHEHGAPHTAGRLDGLHAALQEARARTAGYKTDGNAALRRSALVETFAQRVGRCIRQVSTVAVRAALDGKHASAGRGDIGSVGRRACDVGSRCRCRATDGRREHGAPDEGVGADWLERRLQVAEVVAWYPRNGKARGCNGACVDATGQGGCPDQGKVASAVIHEALDGVVEVVGGPEGCGVGGGTSKSRQGSRACRA